MGNTTTKDIGNFQAGAGKVGADVGVIGAIITAVIMVIIAIVMTVLALTPRKPSDCPSREDEAKDQVNTLCMGNQSSEACTSAKQQLVDAQQHCSSKEKHLGLLFGLLLIPVAILIVWLSFWWKGEVNKNRTAAQIGGTMFEAGLLKNMLHN